MSKKECNVCKINKSIDSFYKNKNSKDGHLNYCKSCHLEKHREQRKGYMKTESAKAYRRTKKLEYEKNHPEKVYARSKRYRQSEKGRNLINAKYREYSDNLTDAHVRQQIRKQEGLEIDDIPQELIDLKRQIILTKRAIKEADNGQ